MSICNPRSPTERWDMETGESLKLESVHHRRQQRPYLKQYGRKESNSNLSSDLHTCTMALEQPYLYTWRHTYMYLHIILKPKVYISVFWKKKIKSKVHHFFHNHLPACYILYPCFLIWLFIHHHFIRASRWRSCHYPHVQKYNLSSLRLRNQLGIRDTRSFKLILTSLYPSISSLKNCKIFELTS